MATKKPEKQEKPPKEDKVEKRIREISTVILAYEDLYDHTKRLASTFPAHAETWAKIQKHAESRVGTMGAALLGLLDAGEF